MDAAAIQIGSSTRPALPSRSLRLSDWVPSILLAALLVCAATLLARRLAGGLAQPLPPLVFLGAVAAAALLALGAHGLPPIAARRDGSPRRFFGKQMAVQGARWLPSAAIVTCAATLSVSGTAVAALIGGWSLIVAEEVVAWQRWRRGTAGTQHKPGPVQPREARTAIETTASAAAVETPSWSVPPLVASSSPRVLQQLTREKTADGLDRLWGWLQTSFEPGERTALVHVAFCPPFAEAPKIAVRPSAGPASRIKPSQILAHGVRLELKLNFASRQPERVLLEFTAESR